jgi:hypothetical protein
MLLVFSVVPTPRHPKVFHPGRAVRNVIFFASWMMALLLSYSLIIEQSAFMMITAIRSAATWVTPLQIAHGAISIHSAGERSINQVMDYACKAVFIKSRFEYKRACKILDFLARAPRRRICDRYACINPKTISNGQSSRACRTHLGTQGSRLKNARGKRK